MTPRQRFWIKVLTFVPFGMVELMLAGVGIVIEAVSEVWWKDAIKEECDHVPFGPLPRKPLGDE